MSFLPLRRLVQLQQILKSTKNNLRNIHLSQMRQNDEKSPKEIVTYGSFEDISDKSRETFLEMIKIFENRDHIYRRGHVEFIYAALKNMESFNVHKDLEVYKSLVDVLPKGKFVPTNTFQIEFMHYPKQQQCIIDVLEQMEDNGVMPDPEMETQLISIFGKWAYPLRKFARMMYWMPKFRNLSPWPLPEALPQDIYELAKLAIARITSIDIQSEITVYQTREIPEAIDDTWIVSGQSPTQRQLLQEHDPSKPLYVEGSFRVWIKNKPINYFMLRSDPKPFNEQVEDSDDVSHIQVPFFNFKPPVKKYLKVVPSVHEQSDGVILALCATGTSSKDSLLSWVRHLEKDGNDVLANVPIVFTLKSGGREVATYGMAKENERIEKK